MKRVAVTGASGNIGRPIMMGLADRYDLLPLSRSVNGADLRDPDGIEALLAGCDAVIHLAWQYTSGKVPAGQEFLDNILMHRNVLHAAKAVGVKRAVMASSVHADYFYGWDGPGLLSVERASRANGTYGSTKQIIEALGNDVAEDSFRVVNVRYGGVTPTGAPNPRDPWERRVWLSHPDLCMMIDAVLSHDDPPVCSTFYAVSDNEGRVHDTTNPFGWTPRDGATALPGVGTGPPLTI